MSNGTYSAETYSPDIWSKFHRYLLAPLWAMKERSPYLRHLKYLEKSQFRPMEEVREDQWRRLVRLLRHAYDNTAYYGAKMKAAGICPEDIRTWDDMAKLPLLTKDDIRACRESMLAGNIPKDQIITAKTSGSTGVSLEFHFDVASQQWKRACAIRHDRWAGWNLGEKIAAFWATDDLKWTFRARIRNLLLDRYSFVNTLKLNEETMLAFSEEIRKKRPTLLFGHAHSLYLFARFLQSRRILDLKPRGIISTCMVLHDYERKAVEEVFSCPVTNRYGCEEVSLIGCECHEHRGLHINCDTLIVEFLRDGKPVAVGEPGAVVVTDLTNYAMPFIRYKVGDTAVPSARSCRCGCTYPVIESVEGRIADYVITPDGRFISGISLDEHFFLHLPDIKQLQIVQEQMDHLLFRIVKGEGFTDGTLLDMGRLVHERFGNEMNFSVEYLDRIQPEKSGKYRFCISKVDNPFF